MSARSLIGAAAAIAAGVALLSANGVAYAGWSDAETIPGVTISSGELALSQDKTTVDITTVRPSDGRTVTGLVPGDTITYTAPVQVHARGDLLTGDVTLRTSGFAGPGTAPQLREALAATMQVHIDTTLPTVAGRPEPTWAITPEQNGLRVTATVTVTVPDLPGLQGQRFEAGTLAWAVTQNGIAPESGGWSDQAGLTTPALEVDALTLSVPASTTTPATSVTNQAATVTGRWAPTTVTARVGATNAASALAGSTLSYATTTTGSCVTTPATWSVQTGSATLPVTPAQGTGTDGRVVLAPKATANLCARLVAGDELKRRFGGQTLTVTTTLAGVVAGTTWTSNTPTWTTTFTVPALPVTPPMLGTPTLTAGDYSVTLPLTGQFTRLEVWAWRPSVGTWQQLTASQVTVTGQSVTLTPGRLDSETTYLRVRAYASSGQYADSVQVIQIDPTGNSGQIKNATLVAPPSHLGPMP
jgi:alternate signal-mediated exported protein